MLPVFTSLGTLWTLPPSPAPHPFTTSECPLPSLTLLCFQAGTNGLLHKIPLGHWCCLDHSTDNQTCQGLYRYPEVAHSNGLTVAVRRASSLTSRRQFMLQNAHGIRPRLRLGITPVPSSFPILIQLPSQFQQGTLH